MTDDAERGPGTIVRDRPRPDEDNMGVGIEKGDLDLKARSVGDVVGVLARDVLTNGLTQSKLQGSRETAVRHGDDP
jgi:hypothetical protein